MIGICFSEAFLGYFSYRDISPIIILLVQQILLSIEEMPSTVALY